MFPTRRNPRRGPSASRQTVLGVEQLETRLAPATRVNAFTVTYQDVDGDRVKVTIDKPLFTPLNVNSVFTFNQGNVGGDNSVKQKPEVINLAVLGVAGLSLSV